MTGELSGAANATLAAWLADRDAFPGDSGFIA